MKSECDSVVDALYIRLTEIRVLASEEIRRGFIVDLDADGRIVGVEILDASNQLAPGAEVEQPQAA